MAKRTTPHVKYQRGAKTITPHLLVLGFAEVDLTDDQLSELIFSGQQALQQSKFEQIDRSQHPAIEEEARRLAEEEKARRAEERK